ncbi:MAG: hypothetical protein P9L99_15380 [Candidatus Lernaella stagnicola]|nr:hypothetical protein [Candidatus Lernaella stagnicola]
MNEAHRKRERYITLAALTLFLATWPLLVRVAPLQDQMDWVLQAQIIADAGSQPWADNFVVNLQPIPNLLGTLVIAGLTKLAPVFTAAALAYALYLILFVTAFSYFARAEGRERPLAELAAVVYAANHFFLMGFFNFTIGLALLFLVLGFLRRVEDKWSVGRWLILAALVFLVYLSHFLTFAVAGLAVLIFACFGKQRGRRLLVTGTAFAPSLACLAWYVSQRAGEFWFHYAFHNPLYYTWYKVGPWAIASSYYPLTPTWAAWINTAINAAAILAVGAFIVVSAVRGRFDRRNPVIVLAVALIIIGLLTPTRIYELLRPGQRLIFVAVLLLFASTSSPATLSTRRFRLAGLAVAALLAWNAVWWFQAGGVLQQERRVLEQLVPPRAKMLILADSHFHFRENRSYLEKAADPYSYPNSVNPLRYLPYHRVITGGGYLRALFGTGIVTVRNPSRLPDVSRIWHLDDPDMVGQYTHLVATGFAANLHAIAERAEPLFDLDYLDERLLVMERRAEPTP